MATFDFPAALLPSAASVMLNRTAQTFRSPFGGTPQVADTLAERWALSLMIPPALLASSGTAEALAMRLAGGVNRVRVSHPIRPTPRGSLRGSPVLHTTATAGALSIRIEGGTAKNRLRYSSFETDTDANGVGTGWSTANAGTVGTITYSRTGSSTHGTYSQRIHATGLAAGTSNRITIARADNLFITTAEACTIAADVRATLGTHVRLYTVRRLIGATVDDLETVFDAPGGTTWQRISHTMPALTDYDEVAVYISIQDGTGAAAYLDVDAVQVEIDTEPTDFEPEGGTLLAGDIIGLNGQWLQVAEDAEFDGDRTMTITLVNRLRDTCTAGTAVEWDAPTIEMAATAQTSAAAYGIGLAESLALDLEEVW